MPTKLTIDHCQASVEWQTTDSAIHSRKPAMTRLIRGALDFQRRIFHTKESLFGRLAKGQRPPELFITCSDSRINPNLLTQTDPGELFILRNAGNLVPPHGGPTGGEEATIEYAVVALKVRDIIICGHSHCGAVQGLLNPQALSKMPRVAEWLNHARAILPGLASCPEGERIDRAIEANVLLQLEHLRGHPPVAEALAARKLRLHGWVYRFETGDVSIYNPTTGRFANLSEQARVRGLVPAEPEAAGERTGDESI
jgi:carbonic anhydrase